MNEGTCRTCGAKIRWVVMRQTEKKNPLDFEPVANGNVHIYEDGTAVVVTKDLKAKMADRFGGVPLYLSHFATCPQRKQHRKPA